MSAFSNTHYINSQYTNGSAYDATPQGGFMPNQLMPVPQAMNVEGNAGGPNMPPGLPQHFLTNYRHSGAAYMHTPYPIYEYYGNSYPIPTSEFEPSISSEDSLNVVQESVLSNESQGHELNNIAVTQNGYAESVTSDNNLKQPRPNVKSHGIFYPNSQHTVPMKKAHVRYLLNQSFRNGHWANNVIVMAKEREGALRDTQNEPEDLDEKGAVGLDIVLERFPEFSKIDLTLEELKSAIKDADNMVLIEDHFLTYKVMGRIVFSGMPTVCQDNHQNGEKRFEFCTRHIGEMFDAFVRSKVGEDDAQELDVRPDLHSVMITSKTFSLNKMEKIFKIFCDCAYQSIHSPEGGCCDTGLSLKNISLRKVPISDNVVTIEENGPTNNNEESPGSYYPTGEEEVPIESEESVHVYQDPNTYPTTTTHLIGPITNLSLSSHAGHLHVNQAWSTPPLYFDQSSALPIVSMKLPNHRHANSTALPHSYRNGTGSRGNRSQMPGSHSKVPPLSVGIPLQQGQRMERSLPPRFQRGMMAQQSNYPPNGNNMVYVQSYHPSAGLSSARPGNQNYHGGDSFYSTTTAPYNDNSHGYVSNSISNQRRGHGSNSDNRSAPIDATSSRNGIHPSGSGRGSYSSGENRRGRSNGYSGSGSSRGGGRRGGGGNTSGHFNDRFHHSSRYSDNNSTSNKILNCEPPAAPSFGEKDFPSLPVTDAIKTNSHSTSAANANAFTENESVNVTVWGTVSKSAPKSGPTPTTTAEISPSEIVANKNFSAPKSPAKYLAKEKPDSGMTTAPPTNQNAWSQNTATPSSKPCEESGSSANNNSAAETATNLAVAQGNKCTSYADILKNAGQSNTQSNIVAFPVEQESNCPSDTAIVSANAATPTESGNIGQQVVYQSDSSTVQVSVMNGSDADQNRPAFPISSRGSSSRGGRGSASSRGTRK